MLALAGQQVLAQELSTDRPPALVMNTHITGLAVARSLGRAGVAVLGLDKEPGGLGQASRHLAGVGLVPGPEVAGGQALAEHLAALGPSFSERPVLFATNDDWLLALARHAEQLAPHYRLPFPAYGVLRRALAKSELYRTCEALGVPTPDSWYLDERPAAQVARQVPYPCVLKPDDSRGFYDAFAAKVFVVRTPQEFLARVQQAAAAGLTLVAQELVETRPGGFWSVASYVSPDGTCRGVFTGRKLEQWPAGFGTSCLADGHWDAALAASALSVVRELGCTGISEVEFVQDAAGRHLLLDVNPRPWKWIGLPVAAGVDLPLLAYADAVGAPSTAGRQVPGARWVFVRDYVQLVRSGARTVPDAEVTRDEWVALLAGRPCSLVDAVHDRDDPGPAYELLAEQLGAGAAYSCAC